MITVSPTVSYVMETPFEMIRYVMCMRTKAKGEVVLWEPILKLIIDCQLRFASFHQEITRLNRQALLKLHQDLEGILTACESDLASSQTAEFHELNCRIQFEKLLKQARLLSSDSLYLATAKEPDESSDDYHIALSAMVEKTLTSTERLKGKKGLMALFD